VFFSGCSSGCDVTEAAFVCPKANWISSVLQWRFVTVSSLIYFHQLKWMYMKQSRTTNIMLNVSTREINKGSKLLLYCLVPVYMSSTPWRVEVELCTFLILVPDGTGQHNFFVILWYFNSYSLMIFTWENVSGIYLLLWILSVYVCMCVCVRSWNSGLSHDTVWRQCGHWTGLCLLVSIKYIHSFIVWKPSTVHSTEDELLSQKPQTIFYMLPVSVVVNMTILCQQYLLAWHQENVK